MNCHDGKEIKFWHRLWQPDWLEAEFGVKGALLLPHMYCGKNEGHVIGESNFGWTCGIRPGGILYLVVRMVRLAEKPETTGQNSNSAFVHLLGRISWTPNKLPGPMQRSSFMSSSERSLLTNSRLAEWLLTGSVTQLVLAIISKDSRTTLERWVFDVHLQNPPASDDQTPT